MGAIHIAETEGRPKQAKILKEKLKSMGVDFTINQERTDRHVLFENDIFGEKPKIEHKQKKKDLVSALEDSTLVPLSAAIYSGAGGYSAIRPGWVGLTPGQFREIRKYTKDKEYEETI